MSKIQVGAEGNKSKSKIIKIGSTDESVSTYKGVHELGLDPKVTEDINKLLKESKESGKPMAPRHDTEKDAQMIDSGSRKGFFYAIYLEQSTKKYKGFAKRTVREVNENKEYSIDIETDVRDTLNECGKDIQTRIDMAYIGYGLGTSGLLIN